MRIGALARLNDVAGDPRVAAGWPVLAEAIHRAASAQLRNLATIGGNLLQRTRCPYFRAEEPVPVQPPRARLGLRGAVQGRSDRHALFGWTEDCGATHPADPAGGAGRARRRGRDPRAGVSGRRIPMTAFHVVPAERLDADTVLEPGELIEAIEMPAPAPHSAYVKVRERASYEYALVSAAATVELAGRRDDRRRPDRPRIGGAAALAAARGRGRAGRPAARRRRRRPRCSATPSPRPGRSGRATTRSGWPRRPPAGRS